MSKNTDLLAQVDRALAGGRNKARGSSATKQSGGARRAMAVGYLRGGVAGQVEMQEMKAVISEAREFIRSAKKAVNAPRKAPKRRAAPAPAPAPKRRELNPNTFKGGAAAAKKAARKPRK